MSKSNQAARTFVSANVKVAGEVREVRFLSNGRVFRATSRGLPRLSLKLDKAHDQVVVRTNAGHGQTSVRLEGTNLAKAFSQAVSQFWEATKGRRQARA